MQSATALCCFLPKLRQSIALSLTTRLTPSGQLTRHRAGSTACPSTPRSIHLGSPATCESLAGSEPRTILCAGRAAAKRSWPQPRPPAAALSSLSLRVREARIRDGSQRVMCMLYGVALSMRRCPAYLTNTDFGRCGGDVGHHRDDLLPRAVRRRAGGRGVMCQEFEQAAVERPHIGARSL